MTSAVLWVVGGLAGAGLTFGATNYVDRSLLACSSNDVTRTVNALARERVEHISDRYGRNRLGKPDHLSRDAIRTAGVVWELGSIQGRGTVPEGGGSRCAAVLTVKGFKGVREQFNVDYIVKRDTTGEALVTARVVMIR
jgi:hypothetical protein